MFQTPLFIFALLFGLSRITLAESSIEKLQSTAAQSIKEAAGVSQAQMAVSLIQSKFFPDAEGNPPVWRVVSDPNSSDKPRIEATEFNAQGTIVNLASSWGNSDYIVDQSGLAALKQTSSLTNPGSEQDGFIGIPNFSGLDSAAKATYFGSATSRFPASTNAIQKVPITFKSLSTGTGELARLNVQVGSINVEIPVPISGGWYQEAYIKAVNGDANDHFGRSAVISGDVLVVGAVNEDSNERTITNGTTASSNNDLVDSGAIYIYRRSGSTWQQEAYIKAPNNSPIGRGGSINNEFGHIPVQISNNTIVVGADGEDGSQTVITNGTYVGPGSDPYIDVGAAYVFRKIGSTWTNEAYLKAPNGNTTSFRFGFSVAISGDTIAVGAIGDASSQITITNGPNITSDASKSNSGAVYIFSRTANQWALQAYLKASNADPGDCFGHSMGISGDVLVVGSNYEASNQTTITNGSSASSNNSSPDSGAVYVFRRNGALWEQEAYLKAPNTGAGDRFGGQYRGVKISGDTIVAGAYLEDSNQTTITNGIPASDNELLSDSGAAYVFRRIGQQWSLEAYLKAPNAGQDDHFGRSLDISGDTIVVGAWYEDSSKTSITNSSVVAENNTASNSGAAYVFKRTGNQWSHEAYLKAANAETGVLGSITDFGDGDKFGLFTSISGDSIAVGAWHEDSNQTTITNGPTASGNNSKPDSGAVYVFRRREVASTPSISSVTPSTAFCPGNSIVIFGSGFMKDAEVKVGDQPCLSKTTQGPNEIVCELPRQPNAIPGVLLDITVTNPNGVEDVIPESFTCDGWYQEAYIKAPNGEAGDYFGSRSAISEDTIVVGASFESSNQTTITNGTTASSNNTLTKSGAAYVFRRVGSNWAPEAYLKASNAGAEDYFGNTVAISADTIVVGAYTEDGNTTVITNGIASQGDGLTDSGAAYVFKRSGTNWVQESYIKASNAGADDKFGYEGISISGDTIVVGAYGEDNSQTVISSADNLAFNSGAAYVFKRTGSLWEQEAYLKAPNREPSDLFGAMASISGDTIVVSGHYEDSAQTTITNGNSASTNNTLTDSGAAYVFRRSGSVWAQEAYLKASNAGANDYFGIWTRISGDTIIVTSREDSNQTPITNGTTASTNNTLADSGAVYVFKRTGSSWTQEAYLKAPNSGASDWFGEGISISGDTIVVGAYQEDSNQSSITNGIGGGSDNSLQDSGAAYVFKRTGTTWAQEAYFKAPNPGASDWFGSSNSISSNTVVVGAYYEDSSQTTITNGQTASSDNSAVDSGAVYVFRRPEKSTTPAISSVTPSQAFCPGSNIVIFGSGFMKDTVAAVDGINCSSTTVQGPNEIICTTPQVTSTEGTALTIRVLNPNGRMDTFLDTSNWVRTTSVDTRITDWIPSGITVTKGKALQITASGTVNIFNNASGFSTGPTGTSVPSAPTCKTSGGESFLYGALLGKIGKNGTPFLIGSSFLTSSAASSGELYLIHNDSNCAADNSGSFSVTITAPKAFNCDLPDPPVISITQQPTNQTAVGGNASFSFSALVTQGATLYYQWQVSTDGGNTFSNLSNQTAATLSLSGLTISQNNFKYRVVLSSSQVSVAGLGLTSATPVTSNNATLTVPPPFTTCYADATGGTVLPDLVLGTEKYRIHQFTTVGTTTFTVNAACPMEVLIVAGGGGGGRGFKASGGGGGGGVINNKTQDLPAGSYTITVGSGGAAGAKGNNSVIAGNGVNLVAIGGGRGGDGESCCNNHAGGDGGSGGGVGQRSGSGAIGKGTTGQGYNGGDARSGNYIAGGGGGGAAGAGTNGSGSGDTVGGNGGTGKQVDIYGKRNPNGSIKYTYFAGGGGGQGESYGRAGGTAGGGGSGGGGLGNGTAGTANTGGGGGGGSGPGGSGIVVIRYRIAP
jgi:hypothetical protein